MRLFSIFLLLISLPVTAQPGGKHAYSFLGIPAGARQAALGGGLVSSYDLDPAILAFDPAQLRNGMHNRSVISYQDYFAGINGGFLAHARQIGKHPYFAGVQYINYGSFTQADETGVKGGEFIASDYAFMVGTARKLVDSVFIIGATLKGIYSSYESYSSWGVAGDVSIGYYNREHLAGASLVASNLGWQASPYGGGERHPLPLNIRAGVTKQLERAPLRLHFTYNYVQKYNITYFDSTRVARVNSLTGEDEPVKRPGLAENLGRHLVVGAEIFPIRSFIVRLGYNYQRRREMVIDTRPGMAGFSWGIGLNLRRFSLNYSRSAYHLAGGVNHLTLVLGLRGGKNG